MSSNDEVNGEEPALTEEGYFSNRFQDRYASRDGGREQARHVFLHANHFRERLQSGQAIRVLELGFGLGINFLTTLDSFLSINESKTCRLEYFSIEKYPVASEFYRSAARSAGFRVDLCNLLPDLHIMTFPGWQRFSLFQGRVVLQLLIGDASKILPELQKNSSRFDIFYADGFSPQKNPEMWSESLVKSISYLAEPNSTLSTWSVAGHFRRALEVNGWFVEKKPGYGGKREMTRARYLNENKIKNAKLRASFENDIVIIGGGWAAAAIARAFYSRGIMPRVFEKSEPGHGASGNQLAALRPSPAAERTALSVLSLYGHCALRVQDDFLPFYVECGSEEVLNEQKTGRYEKYIRSHALPAEMASLDKSAQRFLMPRTGLVKIRELTREWLRQYSTLTENTEITELRCEDGKWSGFDSAGKLQFHASKVILANGVSLRQLLPADYLLKVSSIRGEVLYLNSKVANSQSFLRSSRHAWLQKDGFAQLAATYSRIDQSRESNLQDVQELLASLYELCPERPENWRHQGGRVSFRATSYDRLPFAGETLAGLWVAGCLGSRGLTMGPVIGEQIVSEILHENLALPYDVRSSLHPSRYAQRIKGGKGVPVQ